MPPTEAFDVDVEVDDDNDDDDDDGYIFIFGQEKRNSALFFLRPFFTSVSVKLNVKI